MPYVFVPSKAALGRACGVSRPVRGIHTVHGVMHIQTHATIPCMSVLTRMHALICAGHLVLRHDQRGQPAQDPDPEPQGGHREAADLIVHACDAVMLPHCPRKIQLRKGPVRMLRM